MEGALLECPRAWERLLPPGIRRAETAAELEGRDWDLAGADGGRMHRGGRAESPMPDLLLPGSWERPLPPGLTADTVISCGLSARDSLTLSSLTEPVLCIQRPLPRPDGGRVEPQEFLLPVLPGPAELLPLLGVRLLQIPLTGLPLHGKLMQRGRRGAHGASCGDLDSGRNGRHLLGTLTDVGAVPPAASAAESALRTAAVSLPENTGAGPRLKMEKKRKSPLTIPLKQV
ncbi:MAG: hypothetical protein V8R40_08605 [Dysosmobacter sp.]